MADARTSEDGLTLIELLASITIFMIVLGAVLTVLTATSRSVTNDSVRTQAAMDAQTGLARMVRELRAAYSVNHMSGQMVDVDARLAGQNVRLRYTCDVPFTPDDPANPYDQTYRRCIRQTAPITDPTDPDPDVPALPAASASTGTVIIDRLCPGTGTNPCGTASVFTCRATLTATPGDCAQLPDPPPDPDNPVEETPDPVFPTLVQITVQVPARGGTKSPIGGHRISFSDGVFLDNVASSYDLNN